MNKFLHSTRIFITLDILENSPYRADWNFELSKKGGEFYLDIPEILPIKKDEFLHFNDFSTGIERIHWNFDRKSLMVYTTIIEVSKNSIDKAVEYLLSLGYIKI